VSSTVANAKRKASSGSAVAPASYASFAKIDNVPKAAPADVANAIPRLLDKGGSLLITAERIFLATPPPGQLRKERDSHVQQLLAAAESAQLIAVPPLVYVGFIGFVIGMLLVDLKFFHAEEHEPTMKESVTWVAVWVSLAVAFGIGLWALEGGTRGGEYFAGYLIEYSLSVDNMFVFLLIFSYFQVPLAFQHQVLFYGILGAIVFRGIFIALGAALVHNFEWIIYVFGAFLIYTAFKVATGGTDVNPENNPVLKFAQKRFPTTPRFDGQKLFKVENGRRLATPLFITLIFVETTDIVFAVDSIPAVYGITSDPFIVLTSNVFAILGLRALYFLLAGSMEKFHLLRYGLAIILGFVGVKMLLEAADVEIPIWLSLGVIIFVLAATVILSLMIKPSKKAREEASQIGFPSVEQVTSENQQDGVDEASAESSKSRERSR
jgi:tellurite resistance protein TerC